MRGESMNFNLFYEANITRKYKGFVSRHMLGAFFEILHLPEKLGYKRELEISRVCTKYDEICVVRI